MSEIHFFNEKNGASVKMKFEFVFDITVKMVK